MNKSKKATLKVSPSKAKGGASATLMLQGDLSLDQIVSIKDFLLENLTKYKELSVKINNVEAIDLGLIQLIFSLKRTAAEQGKKVESEFKLSSEQALLLSRSGLENLIITK
ncbi:MAG: STAS domain-containing protein [Bacteroidales bacterium]|nr:STAS domain-containing protein [Bacteroidales bacterium]MBN2750372.1 STAS domain-containing protein [Bacteroidales bacterium]